MFRTEGLASKWIIAYEVYVYFDSVTRDHHVFKDEWTPYDINIKQREQLGYKIQIGMHEGNTM